jgi:hypothetical protein
MYLQETMDLVKRHGLTVENVFAMHLQMTPWTDVTTAVASAVAGQ